MAEDQVPVQGISTLENRYLGGNYAPVSAELTAHELPVTGSLPAALSGRYLRNGPNPLSPPEPSTYHWFTGDGMVHGIPAPGAGPVVPKPVGRSAGLAQALGGDRPGRCRRHGSPRTRDRTAGGPSPWWKQERGPDSPTNWTRSGRRTLAAPSPAATPPQAVRSPASCAICCCEVGSLMQYNVMKRDQVRSTDRQDESSAVHATSTMSSTERYVVIDLPVLFDLEAAMSGQGFVPMGPDYRSRVGSAATVLPTMDEMVQRRDPASCSSHERLRRRPVVLDVRHTSMFDTHLLRPDEVCAHVGALECRPRRGQGGRGTARRRGQEFPRR